MKKIAFVILLAVCALPALAKGKATAKKEIVSVTIRHTACFGRCPMYSIDINKNGVATYTGERFITDSGVYTKNIGKTAAKKILNKFSTYRVDTCQNQYENRIEDLPGVIFTIRYTSGTKTIRNAHFGPAILKELKTEMNSILNQKYDEEKGKLTSIGKTWRKVAPKRK